MKLETKNNEETEKTNKQLEETEEEILEEEIEKQQVEEAEEVEKAKPKAKEEAEEEVVEEKFYTVPLGKAWLMPPNKRAPKAVRILKDFVKRHMKLKTIEEVENEETELKKLIITNEVNEKIWGKGIEKPPRKIRIRAAKDKDGNVTVYLAEGD